MKEMLLRLLFVCWIVGESYGSSTQIPRTLDGDIESSMPHSANVKDDSLEGK